MKALSQYGLMAERHWREFLPKMMAELEAEEQIEKEQDRIRQLIEQHLTPQQAPNRAWQIAGERYIFLLQSFPLKSRRSQRETKTTTGLPTLIRLVLDRQSLSVAQISRRSNCSSASMARKRRQPMRRNEFSFAMSGG